MKAFTPTKSTPAKALLAPLTEAEAAAVPGTLGRITAERVAAYQGAPTGDINVTASLDRLNPDRPSFAEALRVPGLQIIAEVKRRSPSLGAIAELDPQEAATSYAAGGAAALSILTEPNHFGGELAHLEQVAATVALPLLRKDFTVHPAQLLEAKASGASAVLLIVAVLKDRAADYLELTHKLGLDALVEVHDETELDTALKSGATIIGVNNRDLKTLTIDLGIAPRLMTLARSRGFSGLLVAESGYTEAAELGSVYGLADAVLVGSSVAGSGDLEVAVRQFKTGLEALGAPETVYAKG